MRFAERYNALWAPTCEGEKVFACREARENLPDTLGLYYVLRE